MMTATIQTSHTTTGQVLEQRNCNRQPSNHRLRLTRQRVTTVCVCAWLIQKSSKDIDANNSTIEETISVIITRPCHIHYPPASATIGHQIEAAAAARDTQ